MKNGMLLGALGISLMLLLIAAVACGKDLQPRVDELESQVSSLGVAKGQLESQVASLEAEKSGLAEQNETLKDIAGPLPASLDNFFPPKAPAPVYLFEMFALSGPFEGIIVDLQQQDIPGVLANYEAFKAQYEKMAGMVPEWTDRFPMEPVEALGKALASGDPAQVGPAMGQVGQVCGSCHLLSQVKAYQKYHWMDFGTVRVTDPLTNESLPWVEYMMRMAGAYSGIANDLQQGQLDNARQNFQAFSAMFKALPTNACVNCHTTPRTYFVDASIQGMVDQLGEVLAAPSPDPQAVEQLSGAIGMESCMKCHLVHIPAAQVNTRWERFADLFK